MNRYQRRGAPQSGTWIAIPWYPLIVMALAALVALLAGCVTVCQSVDPYGIAASQERERERLERFDAATQALSGSADDLAQGRYRAWSAPERPSRPEQPARCSTMVVWPWTPAPGLAPYDPR